MASGLTGPRVERVFSIGKHEKKMGIRGSATASLANRIEAAKLLVYRAAWAKDNHLP